MDWLLDARRDDAVQKAVDAIEDHLLRHCSEESAVPGALEAVRQHVDRASSGHDGPLLLRLDWARVHPELVVHRLAPDAVDPSQSRFGDVGTAAGSDSTVTATDTSTLTLGVTREVLMNFDPDPVSLVGLDPLKDGAAASTIALAAAAESHPVATSDQVAAAAGALLADAAFGQDDVESVADAVAKFTRLHDALGGASQTVEAHDQYIEISIGRSPFGKAICQIPSLSRVTEAVAGRIAARVRGVATVVHDERLASGDDVDRLRIYLADVSEELAGSVYLWPPAGTHEQADLSPRLEMTMSLPRQSQSVPVVRRLAAQILRAFGVAAGSIHDVELAISEACANVIKHAGDSQGYEVSIELAADRCALTVLDRGEGFDAAGVVDQEDDDAEGGRGLTLMRALVDNLNFVSEPKVGAVVHMVKQLHYDKSHPLRCTG